MTTETKVDSTSQSDAGLPMSPKWDPEKLAAEKEELTQLEARPLLPRAWGYVKRTGPGLLQSAMTLGAGSATASVLAGASFGYKLLWVQPLAMFFGVMMLGALSNVVLTRGERPYESFGKQVWKPLIFLWALGTILSSVIWHFPQYALLAGAGRDLASAAGATISNGGAVPGWIQSLSNALTPLGFKVNTEITTLGYVVSIGIGLCALAMNIFVVANYGKGAKGVKFYERFLRFLIAFVIIFFFIVCVMNFRAIRWGEICDGFVGWIHGLPKNPATGKVESETVLQVLGMLGAAVGINMTFLYPYSLLAKGWGAEHKKLARWDLGMTMFLPFAVVTSLIIVAMTVTVYGDPTVVAHPDTVQTGLKPLAAGAAFKGLPGGQVIFCLGLMGMCGGAISAHMVACGFTLCEMFGGKMTAKRFRLFALTPCIGILGVFIELPMWFPVVASAVCFTMLPIAYLIFFILNNKKSYIGDATGRGLGRFLLNVVLLAALVFAFVGSAISLGDRVVKPLKKAFAKPSVVKIEDENVRSIEDANQTATDGAESSASEGDEDASTVAPSAKID